MRFGRPRDAIRTSRLDLSLARFTQEAVVTNYESGLVIEQRTVEADVLRTGASRTTR
jgi:hypothetical protein